MARVYKGLDVHSDFGGRFPWKSQLVDVGGGVRQAVVDAGPRDAPVTLVCCHGNPTWGYLYRDVIRELSLHYRVVAADDVGFGRSDKPRDPAYYTLDRHILNLETTLDALGVTNAVPLVQDWGGPIGMGWATRHPDRVKGVVIMNTWAFVKGPGAFDLPWLFRFLVLGKGGWKRDVNSNIFTELFVAKGGTKKLSGEDLAPYRAPHPTPEDRVGIARFPQLIPQKSDRDHPEWRTMEAIEDGLIGLRHKPATIIWALKDRAFRKAQLDQWKATFPRTHGPHLLPNAGHYLQEDAMPDVTRLVREFVEKEFPVTAA